MKCLQCGKELALLKKLTESEFCSPEHRALFHDRMQRVSVQRLADSAQRLGFKTRLAAEASETRAKTPPKPRKQEKLPPYAVFIPGEPPDLHDCDLPPNWRVEFDNSDLLIIPPVFSYRPGRQALLARLTYQFLHARPATKRFRDIRIEFAPITAKAVCLDHVLSQLNYRMGAAAGIAAFTEPVNSPSSKSAYEAEFSSFSSAPAQPDLSSERGPSSLNSRTRMQRLEGPDSRLGDVSLHGTLSPAANAGEAVAPELASGSRQAHLRIHGLPFRPRPRGPVSDENIADFESIPSAPQQAKVDPVLGTLSASDHKLAPSALDRPLRMRPRGGVEDRNLPAYDRVHADTADPKLDISIPGFAAASTQTSGPVPADRPAAFAATAAVNVPMADNDIHPGSLPDLVSRPVVPGAENSLPDFAPRFIDRPFRMRPKAGVNSAFAAVDSLCPVLPAQQEGGVAFGTLVPGEIECAPEQLGRTFRMRPRGGVTSSDVPDYLRIDVSAPELFNPPAAIIRRPLEQAIEHTPLIVNRPIRLRPRGPVACDAVANVAGSAAETESLQSAPARGTLPAGILPACAPAIVDRPFRMRPRGPLADTTLPPAESIETGEIASLASKPLANHFPSGILADCIPGIVTKPFRMRPRGGVADPKIATLLGLGPSVTESLQSPAAKIGLDLAVSGLAPMFRDACFRMRPRGPVNDPLVAVLSHIDTEPVPPAPGTPATQSLPASRTVDYQPAAGSRPVVTAPANGVLALAISRFQSLPSSQLIAQKTPAGVDLPVARVNARLEPAFIDKSYRMRPRGPVAGGRTFFALDTGAIELVLPLPLMPEMPAVLMRQASMTFREKPIKMKPRGPKPGSTATSQQIEPLAAEPDSGAEAAASCSALASDVIRPIAIKGSNALQLDVEPADRWMPGIAAAPARSWPVLPVASDSEIFAQTLSNALTPAASLQPSAANELSVTAAAIVPVALPVPVSPIPVPLEVIAPENQVVDEFPRVSPRTDIQQPERVGFFQAVVAFWSGLQLDQKLAGAVSILMFAAFIHSQTAGIPASERHSMTRDLQTANIAANPLPPLKDAASSGWRELEPVLRDRASLSISDDFSSGLRDWDGGSAGLRGWTTNSLGVSPGTLAVYTPSIALSDYQLQFTGEIEKKGLGFVFRALNRKNYYAVKLETIKSGRMRTIYVVRYAVINGKEGPKTKAPLPMSVSNSTILNVGLNAKEQFFTLLVDGKVVDFWSDDRLKNGGIGFFTNGGEQARLHSVRVAHQDDTLGKLCAFLTLQDIQR